MEDELHKLIYDNLLKKDADLVWFAFQTRMLETAAVTSSAIEGWKSIVHELESTVQLVYNKGLKEGIIRFAWWKDGVQYVGTCGTTLESALIDVK